jgi:hypothetical protein
MPTLVGVGTQFVPAKIRFFHETAKQNENKIVHGTANCPFRGRLSKD